MMQRETYKIIHVRDRYILLMAYTIPGGIDVHAYDFTEYLRRRQKNVADLSEEEMRFLPQISASDAIERVLLHSVRPAEVEHLTPGNPAWQRYLERKLRKQGKLD